jgi:ankyrin repeat protein
MFGMMPLHEAVLAGNRELAALLLEHGADAAARYRKRTPTQLAVLAGNASLAAWLASYRRIPLATRGTRADSRTSASSAAGAVAETKARR